MSFGYSRFAILLGGVLWLVLSRCEPLSADHISPLMSGVEDQSPQLPPVDISVEPLTATDLPGYGPQPLSAAGARIDNDHGEVTLRGFDVGLAPTGMFAGAGSVIDVEALAPAFSTSSIEAGNIPYGDTFTPQPMYASEYDYVPASHPQITLSVILSGCFYVVLMAIAVLVVLIALKLLSLSFTPD